MPIDRLLTAYGLPVDYLLLMPMTCAKPMPWATDGTHAPRTRWPGSRDLGRALAVTWALVLGL